MSAKKKEQCVRRRRENRGESPSRFGSEFRWRICVVVATRDLRIRVRSTVPPPLVNTIVDAPLNSDLPKNKSPTIMRRVGFMRVNREPVNY